MENEQELPQANGEYDYSEDGDDAESSDCKQEAKPASFKELAIRIGGIGSFAMQCVVVLVTRTPSFNTLTTTSAKVGRGMVWGSAGLGAVNSPVVVYKERQLTKEDTFRTALNGIREEQGRLTEQNDVLSAEIDDLQGEVDRMKDVELALRELSETQGSQLDELMDLINENKEINEGMRLVLKNKALEEVISLVLDIDNDGSFTIQNREVDRLIIGMRLIEEISFCEKMFRQDVVDCDGNVDEVIGMIKRMIHGGEKIICPETGNEIDDTRCTIDIEDPEEWFRNQKKKRDSLV